MKNYQEVDLLTVAKRYNNPKRSYLLINPLQAKHIPVSPTVALEMMRSLGEKIKMAYPQVKIVIGFAETATAIGAAVAGSIAKDCFYIHTTRENLSVGMKAEFNEEHSHAPEQWLYTDRLTKLISLSSQIVFVDDEISTGRTLINIVKKLRETIPTMRHLSVIAASVVNRLSSQDEQLLAKNGIETLSLLKIEPKDYTQVVNDFSVEEAKDVVIGIGSWREFRIALTDPRSGVAIGDYIYECKQTLWTALKSINLNPLAGRILVLGTEECMYPSLLFGEMLEEMGFFVRCHATTRSPIGISSADNYPIHVGYRLHSFYTDERKTYLYNLDKYNVAFIVSDTMNDSEAIKELSALLNRYGCKDVYYLRG